MQGAAVIRAISLVAFAVFSCACTTWHECSAHDRQRFIESSLPPSQIPPHAKALAHRIVATGEGAEALIKGPGIYTHASQYKPADGVSVDFAREEIVRIANTVAGPQAILWVAETDIEVVIGVLVQPTPCTAYPSPPPATSPVDVVIALTTKPIRLVQHDTGPACVMNGQP
jgi:hypothetical protein